MLGFAVGLHVFLAILLIIVILMQQSHGSGISSVFGGGGSGSFFGGRGASPLLRKITIALAALFFITSSSIAIMVPRRVKGTEPEIQKKLMQTLPSDRGIPREETPFATVPEKEKGIPVEQGESQEKVLPPKGVLPIPPEGGD
ncbi:MAG: preprotein translocase subunit SecG [candidate division WOR-3 bacterium]|nr:preprotein translocase subunit SecG [candidate division WOR-3 bacterium]